jgi:HEPN domain-containing protein
MRNLERANQWLRRAKSNMARARAGRVSPEILYEDLCFDSQQVVEKSLKALCAYYSIAFPRTHDIAYLIELLTKGDVTVPEDIQHSKLLTSYAVEARYQGDYEPIDESDYAKAVEIAEKVLAWVEKNIEEEK